MRTSERGKKRGIFIGFRKMRGIVKMNIFHVSKDDKRIYIYSRKFRERESSRRILQKRVNNGGIFPRVSEYKWRSGIGAEATGEATYFNQ